MLLGPFKNNLPHCFSKVNKERPACSQNVDIYRYRNAMFWSVSNRCRIEIKIAISAHL